jgi:translin
MDFSKVELSLVKASSSLDELNSRRERLIKESREVISFCSKTIISIHTLDLKQAKRQHIEAKRKLSELKKVAGSDLTKYVVTPEQEFVEASVMLAIVRDQDLPSIEEIGVPPASYVLGLLDSIGEIKRSVFDSIRRDQIADAEASFGRMENLFVLLSPLAVYDHVVPGLRRKLDVARILIEDTRSAITEETRRSDFIKSITELSSKLGVQSPVEGAKRTSLSDNSIGVSSRD